MEKRSNDITLLGSKSPHMKCHTNLIDSVLEVAQIREIMSISWEEQSQRFDFAGLREAKGHQIEEKYESRYGDW